VTKRSNKENEAASARAEGGFNRVADLLRSSAEIARATARLTKIARSQVPLAAPTLVPKTQRFDTKRSASAAHNGSRRFPEGDGDGAAGIARQPISADAIHAIDGFAARMKTLNAMTRVGQSVLAGKATEHVGLASGSKTSNAFHAGLSGHTSDREAPEDTTSSSRARFAQMIRQSSLGMEALTRIGNSERRFGVGNDSTFLKRRIESGARFEQGSGPSWSGLAGRATRMIDRVSGFSISGDEGSRRSVGKYVAASRVARSAMVAPTGLSIPEFAEPMRGVHGQESRNAGSITINSTPTVVINASEGSGDVEGQVIAALRTHRDELFDQFKRESVRRERTEF
jgi:hypothetical protein